MPFIPDDLLPDTPTLEREAMRALLQQAYNAGYGEGVDDVWAMLAVIATDEGDPRLLAHIKARLDEHGVV